MYTYLVHVEFPSLSRYNYVTQDANGRAITVETMVPQFVPQNPEIRPFEEGTHNKKQHAETIRTFQFRSETEATAIARMFAEACPGTKVLVAKVVAIAQASVTPAILSSVTDKGIVPR